MVLGGALTRLPAVRLLGNLHARVSVGCVCLVHVPIHSGNTDRACAPARRRAARPHPWDLQVGREKASKTGLTRLALGEGTGRGDRQGPLGQAARTHCVWPLHNSFLLRERLCESS